MSMDLSACSLQELRDLLPKVREQIDALKRQQHDLVVEELRQLAESRGYKLEALAKGIQTPARKKLPAQFKDPQSGKTWSGRGRKPKWVEQFLTNGGNLDSLKI